MTDEKGMLCGKIFGDLGADVIKIEPPGGDSSRRIGPFYHDRPDPEKSLFWFAYNTSKRGITLDINTADGQKMFKKLAKKADAVIESFPPGYMKKLGLGYPALSQINPGIILTSITPFGQTGPYKNYKGPDIVVWAMGGSMYVMGDPDRPPVQVSFPYQAHLHAAAVGATGTAIALYHKELTGEGQRVDISAQHYLLFTLFSLNRFWDLNGTIIKRGGSKRFRSRVGTAQRIVWPCKDGHVNFFLRGGPPGARHNQALATWMHEEGTSDDFLQSLDWNNLDWDTDAPEFLDLIQDCIGKFFLTHTKAELFEGAVKRQFTLFPVANVKDTLESVQLNARDYWAKVEHPELGDTITYPGAFAKLPNGLCQIHRRAPLIGEHNEEIYSQELGLSKEELTELKQGGII